MIADAAATVIDGLMQILTMLWMTTRTVAWCDGLRW